MNGGSGPQRPPQRLRWRIGGLLGAGVLINYFDRISLSVTGPQLQGDFALDPISMGILLSAFFWSYALLQIPAGLLLDRYGVATVGRWSTLCWVLASALAALSTGFVSLLIARILLGIAEAPSFPANAKATGLWFPRHERALSTAIFDAAAKFSNVIGVPIIALAAVGLGWRWGFGLVAALSLLYCAAFWRYYRDPSRHPLLKAEERAYIQTYGALPEQPVARPGRMLGYVLGRRKVWGLTLGFAAYGYCFYFFLSWLPTYLVQALHLSLLASAGVAAVPWICATVSDLLVGGWLIDSSVARGFDESRVRKTVLLVGLGLGLAVLGATATSSGVVAVACICIALSGLAAAAPVCWSLPALIAPAGGTGTVASIMNFGNNLMGAAGPIVTGFIVARTHSFAWAFTTAGIILLGGLLSFAFLMGPIDRIPDPPKS